MLCSECGGALSEEDEAESYEAERSRERRAAALALLPRLLDDLGPKEAARLAVTAVDYVGVNCTFTPAEILHGPRDGAELDRAKAEASKLRTEMALLAQERDEARAQAETLRVKQSDASREAVEARVAAQRAAQLAERAREAHAETVEEARSVLLAMAPHRDRVRDAVAYLNGRRS